MAKCAPMCVLYADPISYFLITEIHSVTYGFVWSIQTLISLHLCVLLGLLALAVFYIRAYLSASADSECTVS